MKRAWFKPGNPEITGIDKTVGASGEESVETDVIKGTDPNISHYYMDFSTSPPTVKQKDEATIAAEALTAEKAGEAERVKDISAGIRAQAVSYSDPFKIAGWVLKAERAKRIKAGTADATETAIQQAEVDKRQETGETVETLADIQIAKANDLAALGATLDGVEDKAYRTIEEAADSAALAAAMTTITAELEAVRASISA